MNYCMVSGVVKKPVGPQIFVAMGQEKSDPGVRR